MVLNTNRNLWGVGAPLFLALYVLDKTKLYLTSVQQEQITKSCYLPIWHFMEM